MNATRVIVCAGLAAAGLSGCGPDPGFYIGPPAKGVPGLVYRKCQAIPTTGIQIGVSGLNTKIFGTNVALASATFSQQAIQNAGQELQILSQAVAYYCSMTLGNPDPAIIDKTQDYIQNLTTLAMNLSAATNDQQVNDAVTKAQTPTPGAAPATTGAPPTGTAPAAPSPPK